MEDVRKDELTLKERLTEIETQCRKEVSAVLAKYNCSLIPIISIGPNGVVGASVNITAKV